MIPEHCEKITQPMPGMRVVIARIGSTMGMIIHEKHLKDRERFITYSGKLGAYVPGHGGDVWFVDIDAVEGSYAFSLEELVREVKGDDNDKLCQAHDLLLAEYLNLRKLIRDGMHDVRVKAGIDYRSY